MTDTSLPVIDAHAHVGVQKLQDHMPGYWPEGKNGQSEADMLACMDATGVDYAVLHNLQHLGHEVRGTHGSRARRPFHCRHKGRGWRGAPPAPVGNHSASRGGRRIQGAVLRPLATVGRRLRQLPCAERFWPVWELVDQMKLPVCTVSYGTDSPDHFQALIKLLDAWPDLTITVVHGLYVGMKAPEGLIDANGPGDIRPGHR